MIKISYTNKQRKTKMERIKNALGDDDCSNSRNGLNKDDIQAILDIQGTTYTRDELRRLLRIHMETTEYVYTQEMLEDIIQKYNDVSKKTGATKETSAGDRKSASNSTEAASSDDTLLFSNHGAFTIQEREGEEYPTIVFECGRTNVVLTPYKMIGHGSFGTVVLYKTKANAEYAVKIGHIRTNVVPEHPIIKSLMGVRCKQIRARVVGTLPRVPREEQEYTEFNLLDKMTGDLGGRTKEKIALYQKCNKLETYGHAVLHILEDVREQLLCLFNVPGSNGSNVYHDLKLQNVLYKHDASAGTMKIHIGDLGSMSPDENNAYVGTYPCLPTNKSFRIFKSIAEVKQCYSYQLGLLLAALLNINLGELLSLRDKTVNPKYLKEAIGRIGYDIYIALKESSVSKYAGLWQLVQFDPSKRIFADEPFVKR